MSRRKDSFRDLVERDADSVGHMPVSLTNGVSHTVGNFEFMANGDLLCGTMTYRDMEAVSAGDKHMPAERKPGYGKPLFFGKGNTPTAYRYVQKSWYRLTEGGSPFGKSPFFSSSAGSGPMLVQTGDKPLRLAGGEYCVGGSVDAALVTLFADGGVRVFDLEFLPGVEIDVSSPRAELARLWDSPHLAVRVPEDNHNYMLDYPHALAPKTRWLAFAGGNWYWQDLVLDRRINSP